VVLDVVPLDSHVANVEACEGLECAEGEIDGITVVAGWANVSNESFYGVTIGRVLDVDSSAALAGLDTKVVSVAVLINGSDEFIVIVPVSACSRIAILVKPSGKSTIVHVAAVAATATVVRASVLLVDAQSVPSSAHI